MMALAAEEEELVVDNQGRVVLMPRAAEEQELLVDN